jgi:sterol desaturase/sphingolipid hydroxylase (fatty acid hydroxylase superfamily)
MTPILASLAESYHWQLSIYTALGIAAVTMIGKQLLMLSPTIRQARVANAAALEVKMEKPAYAANQKLNRKWGLFFWLAIFAGILPFCLTIEAQPWWRILRDVVLILMVYDFFYYLGHRFLFHDEGFFGGPLLWVHAVHHRQRNPCRGDSSYIHPIEVAIGLGLYVGTIVLLSLLLGSFHVVTVVITWVAFSQINNHNHDLWTADRFPFRYLKTMSVMHHNHHASFTGGNFATISLLYDWLFGTLDYTSERKGRPVAAKHVAEAG